MNRTATALALAWLLWTTPAAWGAPRADGQLEISVVDGETGQPVAARMHLKNSRGRPVRLRLPGVDLQADHFYIDGRITLPLGMGQYTFELEAGPEYRTQNGHFAIERHADDTKTIEMNRFADLAKEGWYAGDLDATVQPQLLPLAMRAEALRMVPTQAEAAGSLLKLEGQSIARTPFAWDLPVWLAGDELDAICVVNHHALRAGAVDNEGEGRPRDRTFYPGKTGNGRWSESIYYHALNCGLRVPPAGGSGAGTNASPLGTNRVYVHCGDDFTPARWWDGLEAGRVFVTNGPLLRPLVEGQPPGYVFRLDDGERLSLEIGLNLATREPVEYLEVIKNGDVEIEARLDEWAKQGGRLPPLAFDESGWFLVRAVTTNTHKYQFASSGPYYVERSGRPRVSRRSVEFLLAWIDAAAARLRDLADLDEPTRSRLLAEQASARKFFEELRASANAD